MKSYSWHLGIQIIQESCAYLSSYIQKIKIHNQEKAVRNASFSVGVYLYLA